MQIQAVYTVDPPSTFRAFALTVTVESEEESKVLREVGFNDVTIPRAIEETSSLTGPEIEALKSFQRALLSARGNIQEPVLITNSGKVAAARLKA